MFHQGDETVLSFMFLVNAVFGLEPEVTSFTSQLVHSIDKINAILRCEVTQSPTASIQISRIAPGDSVVISLVAGSSKYWSLGDRNHKTLYITPFTSDDVGDYRCTIHDVDQHDMAYKQIRVNFEELPSIIEFPDKKVYDLDKGHDFKLYCNATGIPEPKVWWEKEGDAEFKKEGPLLHIPYITEDDIGTYYCVADNNIKQPARKHTRIRYVYYAPEVTCNNTNITSRQGWAVYAYLICEVRAYPSTFVVWWKKTDGVRERIIGDDVKYTIYHSLIFDNSPQRWHYKNFLWVMVTEPNDAGKYIATASNRLGTQEIEFYLTVV